jgi:hypothetical protein
LLACGTLLGSSGRVAAVPAADADARRWLEMVSNTIGQPGKVFNADLSIRERSDAGEINNRGRVWIDAEQRKGRFELRQDDAIVGVTLVDNWDVATFDALVNKVNTITIPEDNRTNVRNPAFSVLTPSIIAAFQAGQINPEADVITSPNEQFNGRPAVKLAVTVRINQEIQVPPQSQGGQPTTQNITITQEYNLFLDPNTGMPLQESVRTGDNNDREVSFRNAVYDSSNLLDRSAVAPDVLSLQAVQGMQASMDQQLERARRIGFPLFWLGRELPRPFTDAKGQRQSSLVLNDVQVVDRPNVPRAVILIYGTRDEPQIPYVILASQLRSDWETALTQVPALGWLRADGVQRSQLQVPAGGQGTLYQFQIPAQQTSGSRPGSPPAASGSRPSSGGPMLLQVQVVAGDGVTVIDTPPLPPFTQEGRQSNPFLDAQQISAIAGALARLNP